MTLIFDTGGVSVNGTPAEWLPRVSFEPYGIVSGSLNVVSTYTLNDAVYGYSEYTGSIDSYRVNVEEPIDIPGHELEVVTTSLATLNGNVLESKGLPGIAEIRVRNAAGSKRAKQQLYVGGFNLTGTTFQSFVAGSLGKHITDAMLAMVSGKDAGNATQNHYQSIVQDLDNPACVLNPDLFTGSMDLSAIGILNKNADGTVAVSHPGLLISPRHLIAATHFLPYSPVIFRRPDGSYQSVNIIGRKNNVGTGTVTTKETDISVLYLDADVTGIDPFVFMPPDWHDYIPSLRSGYEIKLPVLSRTVHDIYGNWRPTLSVQLCFRLNLNLAADDYTMLDCRGALSSENYLSPPLPTDAFASRIRGGDSGGPIMALVNGVTVLLCTNWSGGGSDFALHATVINAAMNALSAEYVTAGGTDPANGTYAMQTVDLSGFTNYA